MRLNVIAPLKQSHFILMSGQSNAAGYQDGGDSNTYLPRLGQLIYDCPSDEWQHLQQNWNNGGTYSIYRGSIGCEMRLMQMLKDYYGGDQFLFKYSAGGTSISPIDSIEDPPRYNWGPESVQPYMYHGLISSARKAFDSFPAQFIKPKVLVWIQGENDTDAEDANNYQVNFADLIASIKRDLNLPNLKICQTLLADTQTAYNGIGKTIVNQAKINYSVNGNKYINIDGAEVAVGGVHFTAAGQDYIAQKIFDVLKTML